MYRVLKNTQLTVLVLVFATARSVGAQGVGDSAKRPDPWLPAFPLLIEHDLPRILHVTTRDSLALKLTIRNRGSSAIFLKFGSCALKVEAYPIRRSDSQKRVQHDEQIVDLPGAWGNVRYLQVPSPSTPCTMVQLGLTLQPEGMATFPWRASPLPLGEYRFRVCFDLDEYARRGEGGAQDIHWCTAQVTHVVVSSP